LLAQRLAGFEQSHAGIHIEVRIKDLAGRGGLLETLTAAAEAAPDSLPDLISLDLVSLNAAALKGLVVPLSGVVGAPQAPGWYDYAAAASEVDGSFYGLPFASDADVLAYRTDAFSSSPLSWSDVLDSPGALLFPAADPTASFTLAQYLALDAPLEDNLGRATLEANTLTSILSFYDSAHSAGVVPITALQYTTSTQTWSALREGRAMAAVAPFHAFAAEHNPSIHLAGPLPTRDGAGITFCDVWSWAIVTHDPARQALAAELLDWLMDPEFLGPWSHALSLLPPTRSALALWPQGPEAGLANRLVTAAQPRPPAETLATFGPALRRAVDTLLNGQASAGGAALAAVQAIRTP
jgi:ABC-type glycerol-3-phosphate transport system substrate-binding protein